MPKQKDLKRRVRARMQKTGEAYTAARARVVAKKRRPRPAAEKVDHAAIAGMSDAAVEAKTGKDWKGWVRLLDAAHATSMAHRDIARYLHEEHGVPGWWAQMVTVAYERIRGLREKGQRRGGGFDVGKSKTFPVPVEELYAAFSARRRWLGDARIAVKKATANESMRLTWEDGAPVEVYFLEKGRRKSQVHVQHRRLATRADAERVRAEWTARLAALGEVLGGR